MRTISFVRTGVAAFTTAALSIAAPSAAYAAAVPMALSNATGPSGGGNILTGTTNTDAFRGRIYPTVQFQYYGFDAPACRPTAREIRQIAGNPYALTDGALTVDPDTVRLISPRKLAFTVPSSSYPAAVDGSPSTVNTGGLALLDGQTSAKWNVCVYDSDSPTTSTLLASALYTINVRPQITAITPTSVPTYGGQTITVTGVGLGAGTTATIDGAPLTNIRTTGNGTSFTATTPAHPQGSGYTLTVKTIGGQIRSSDPDNNGLPEDGDPSTPDAPILFDFTDSIGVTPSAAVAGTSVYLDILGAGFEDLNIDQTGSAAPTDPVAHVFLVQGSYDSVGNRGVQECRGIVVIDDSELVCELDLAADSLDPHSSSPQPGYPVDPGDYTVSLVSDGSVGAQPTVSSSGTFTVIPV